MKEKIVIAFDTETTGLIKPEVQELNKQPQIIEYYGAKLIHRSDGIIEQIDELETFLKPEQPFSEKITKITGITNEMVEGADSFLKFFPRLADFHIGVDEWVAHNCAFDAAMVANEVARIGKIIHFPFPPKHTCTVQGSMKIEQRRLTLTNLHKELFGVPFEGAHRAKDDVQAMIRCYKELIVRGYMK